MPFNFNECNCAPLVIDNEFNINNEALLADYVGRIVLGHYAHVKKIIKTLNTIYPEIDDDEFDLAIAKMDGVGKSAIEIEKRDGWIFQMISWLSLFKENNGKKFYCQQPHDASAQHGLDGVSVTLNDDFKIDSITITEDKCTVNHRILLPKVWKEFEEFERGIHNNKLVSRISAMLELLDDGKVLEANQNDIYKNELRKYRVGINRNDTYDTLPKRKKLFKGFNECVKGDDPHRRYAATFDKNDIRAWMEQFSQKVITYLETQKTTHV